MDNRKEDKYKIFMMVIGGILIGYDIYDLGLPHAPSGRVILLFSMALIGLVLFRNIGRLIIALGDKK